jgi:hypothetical protein
MALEAQEIDLNDLIPIGAWAVGVIHGQTPQGTASYVVVAPQAEASDEDDELLLQPMVMTVELAQQLIEMLRTQVGLINSGDPFGGLEAKPVRI